MSDICKALGIPEETTIACPKDCGRHLFKTSTNHGSNIAFVCFKCNVGFTDKFVEIINPNNKEAADHAMECPKCSSRMIREDRAGGFVNFSCLNCKCEFTKEYLDTLENDLKAKIKEAVDHPAHYGGADNPYEAIKVIRAWMLGFSLGNAVKYIARAGKKGDALEDLRKARWYLDEEIKHREALARSA